MPDDDLEPRLRVVVRLRAERAVESFDPRQIADAARRPPRGGRLWGIERMRAMISSSSRAPIAGVAVLAAATAVLVIVLMNTAGQGSAGSAEPTQTASAAAASASQTGETAASCRDIADLSGVEGPSGPTPLPSGCWFVGTMPIHVEFTVPRGWSQCCAGDNGVNLVSEIAGSPDSTGRDINFRIVEGLYADACDPQRGQAPPTTEVGSTVDDLVAGLTALEGFQATAASDVTVDGYVGKELQLVAPADPCPDANPFWFTDQPDYFMDSGEVMRVIVLDVDGVHLLIKAGQDPVASLPQDRDELDEILNSIRIGP